MDHSAVAEDKEHAAILGASLFLLDPSSSESRAHLERRTVMLLRNQKRGQVGAQRAPGTSNELDRQAPTALPC